ncbi:NADP-dependent isocitrate dehydrogenase [Kocuria rhizophila]|nr:NADP-dependent isocitrate dehydrogenase [Kocuria rhizophila]
MPIIYTETDEKRPCWPRTGSSPWWRQLASTAGVEVETQGRVLAARILAQFPDRLTDEQHRTGRPTRSSVGFAKPEARPLLNFPTSAASIPQLKATMGVAGGRLLDLPDSSGGRLLGRSRGHRPRPLRPSRAPP